MSIGRLKGIRLTLAAVLIAAAALPVHAQQPASRRGRSIEFSEPRSDVTVTNVNQLRTRPTTLQDLEQQLKKPFELLDPGEDAASRLAPPPMRHPLPSAARSQRMKDILDKRKDWIFMAPEDFLATDLELDDALELTEPGLGGEGKKRKTTFEKYIERLEKTRAAAQAAATNRGPGAEVFGDRSRDFAEGEAKGLRVEGRPGSLPGGWGNLDAGAQRLNVPGFNPAGTPAWGVPGNSGLNNAFGFGSPSPTDATTDRPRGMETRMQEFKQLLDSGARVTPGLGADPPLAGLGMPAVSAPALSPGLAGGLPGGGMPGGFGAPPNLGSLTLTPGLPSLGSSPALPAWQTPLPEAEPPRVMLPAPKFEIPQRKF